MTKLNKLKLTIALTATAAMTLYKTSNAHRPVLHRYGGSSNQISANECPQNAKDLELLIIDGHADISETQKYSQEIREYIKEKNIPENRYQFMMNTTAVIPEAKSVLNYLNCPNLIGVFYDGDGDGDTPDEAYFTAGGTMEGNRVTYDMISKNLNKNNKVNHIFVDCHGANALYQAFYDKQQPKFFTAGFGRLMPDKSDEAGVCMMKNLINEIAAKKANPSITPEMVRSCIIQFDNTQEDSFSHFEDQWGYFQLNLDNPKTPLKRKIVKIGNDNSTFTCDANRHQCAYSDPTSLQKVLQTGFNTEPCILLSIDNNNFTVKTPTYVTITGDSSKKIELIQFNSNLDTYPKHKITVDCPYES